MHFFFFTDTEHLPPEFTVGNRWCLITPGRQGHTVPIKQTMELARRKLSGLLASGCGKTHISTSEAGTAEKTRSLKSALAVSFLSYPTKPLFFPVSVQINSSYKRHQPRNICHQVLEMQVSLCSSTLDVFPTSSVLKRPLLNHPASHILESFTKLYLQ